MTAVSFFSAVVILAVIFGFLFFLYYFLLGMWIRTIAAGVPLSIVTLIRMRLGLRDARLKMTEAA